MYRFNIPRVVVPDTILPRLIQKGVSRTPDLGVPLRALGQGAQWQHTVPEAGQHTLF